MNQNLFSFSKNAKLIINYFIIIIILVFIVIFGLGEQPYNIEIMEAFHQPYIRFILYIILYALVFYNHIIAVLYMIFLILLHLEYLNLYL